MSNLRDALQAAIDLSEKGPVQDIHAQIRNAQERGDWAESARLKTELQMMGREQRRAEALASGGDADPASRPWKPIMPTKDDAA